MFSYRRFQCQLRRIVIGLPRLQIAKVSPRPNVARVGSVIRPKGATKLIRRDSALEPSTRVTIRPVIPSIGAYTDDHVEALNMGRRLINGAMLVRSKYDYRGVYPIFPMPHGAIYYPVNGFGMFLYLE